MVSRFRYRLSQFCRALRTSPDAVDAALLQSLLTPAQIVLYRRMQPSEQVHAYHVLCGLREQGNSHTGLLAAALLHDVGKVLHPLSPLERVVIVLGKWLFPRAYLDFGLGQPAGFRRPFVVAVCHADWGAELAVRAGASALVVSLIRRHHEPGVNPALSDENRLLHALQVMDESK